MVTLFYQHFPITGAHTSRSAQSQSRWKVKVKFAQSCLTLCDPVDYTVHGILQARRAEWVPFPSPGHLPNPGTEARSPTLQAESLPAEATGKLKNTRVGNLRLRQGIFPTQELNQGLLRCRFFISWTTREALVSPGSTRKGHIEDRQLSRGPNEEQMQSMQLSKEKAL